MSRHRTGDTSTLRVFDQAICHDGCELERPEGGLDGCSERPLKAGVLSVIGSGFGVARRGLLVAAAAFLVCVAASTAAPVIADAEDSAASDRLIVGYETQRGASSMDADGLDRTGVTVERPLPLIDGAVVKVAPGDSLARARSELEALPGVKWAVPDYVRRSTAPNDPLADQQWGLTKVGAVESWTRSTGSGATVAVIDTGIDMNHPDLAGGVWRNPAEIENGFDDDANGRVDDTAGYDFVNLDNLPADDNGHGSHVSGIIGARSENFVGVAGVAPQAKILPLKALGSDGNGFDSDVIDAIDYALANDVRIINLSLGGPDQSPALRAAIARAGDQEATIVVAAGNTGSNIDVEPNYPASYSDDNLIVVAASTEDDSRASFSNFGVSSVDLASPGAGVLSTVPGGTYNLMSGTSMATPFVSAAAALLVTIDPSLTPAKIRTILMTTADPVPAFSGATASGARLNVARAVGATVTPKADNPITVSPVPEAPTRFELRRPLDKTVLKASRGKRMVRFAWQRSRSSSSLGLARYELIVDGKRRATIRDPDGPEGPAVPDAGVGAWIKKGRHAWHVTAVDRNGLRTDSTARRRSAGRRPARTPQAATEHRLLIRRR